MSQRIDFMKQSPGLAQKLIELDRLFHQSSIEEPIRHLVMIRASQINNCAFCIDMHIKQATMHGERPLRVHHLPVWRESTVFSQRERASLAWTEVLTRLPEQGVPDELYELVRTELSEPEISDLSFIVGAINAWNRINIGFRSVPGSRDKAFGSTASGLE
ncbi:carboxymuconolactone decarboxylase family protein [Luteimonas sp. SDU82]|uniref:carboxymuconolactone decarboxylase family protein n=1 Tax=Luteimonas sp. SDU82 TaxID=3422592 RepID=UPI003EB7E2AD